MKLSRMLSAYIGRQFLFWFACISLSLIALILMLDTLELFRRASSRAHEVDMNVVLSLALMKLPSLIEKAIPFSTLLGAMFAFWRLNRHHEFVVARAAGVSIWQFLSAPIAIALLIGFFKIALFNPFSAAMLLKYETLEAKTIRGQSSSATLANQGLWFRQTTGNGHYILRARSINPREVSLNNVIMILLGENDEFIERIDAPTAALEPGFWRIESGTVTSPNAPPKQIKVRQFPTDLTVGNINDSFASPETISFWKLPAFIKILENAGFPGTRHLLYWHSHLALPFLLAAVVLLAATFSLRPIRRGGTAILIVSGICSGFLLYFLSDVVFALGISSKIPIILAAWSPALVSASIGIAILLHLEDG